jgi:hypothetical protein
MALTRAQIKSKIASYSGKGNKDTFIEEQCDTILKGAMLRHNFEEQRDTSDVVGVIDETSIAVPSGAKKILSIVVIDSSNRARVLKLKPDKWYADHVGSPEANLSGWPEYACRFSSTIELDRPINEAYTFRVRYTKYATFTTDETECPVDVLDNFLVYYITAMVYAMCENLPMAQFWFTKAIGRNIDDGNWDGGEFAAAVKADEELLNIDHDLKDMFLLRNRNDVIVTDDGRLWQSP